MSGDLARIKREIKEVDNIIDTYNLKYKRMVTFITLAERDEIYRNIDMRFNVLDRLRLIEGELVQKTLPSGTLVNKREEWIMKLEHIRSRIDELKIAQAYDMNIVKNNNFPLPSDKS